MKSKMPNDSKGYGPDSGKHGSNHGKSSGLRKESGTNQGAMKPPTNKNPYPNGIA